MQLQNQKGFIHTLATLIVLAAALIGLFIYWQYKNGSDLFCAQVVVRARNPLSGEVKEFATPCDVPKGWEELKIEKNNTQDLLKHNDPYLEVSFSYPREWGEPKAVESSEQAPGQTGWAYSLTFTDTSGIEIAARSADFRAPRGGYFGDSGGYIKRGSNYYLNFVGTEQIITSPVEEIQAVNTKVLFIYGTSSSGPTIFPTEGDYGAVVNLDNEKYTGMTLYLRGSESISKDEFVALLKALEVK